MKPTIYQKFVNEFFEDKVITLLDWDKQDFVTPEEFDIENAPGIIETENYFVINTHGLSNGMFLHEEKVRECLEFLKYFNKPIMIFACWGCKIMEERPEYIEYLVPTESVGITRLKWGNKEHNEVVLILREVARPLHRDRQLPLVERVRAGDPARDDLAGLGVVRLQRRQVLVVDLVGAVGRELAELLAPEKT